MGRGREGAGGRGGRGGEEGGEGGGRGREGDGGGQGKSSVFAWKPSGPPVLEVYSRLLDSHLSALRGME